MGFGRMGNGGMGVAVIDDGGRQGGVVHMVDIVMPETILTWFFWMVGIVAYGS